MTSSIVTWAYITVFKIKSDYIKIHPSPVFNAPAEEFPWNFVTVFGLKKTRLMYLRECHCSDGQTDGFDIAISQSACATC